MNCKARCQTGVVVNKVYNMIHLSTAIGLTPDGSIRVHMYTQTIHRTTQGFLGFRPRVVKLKLTMN
jgi:hypothetical protein